jgi:hypothetical protein
MEVNFEEVLPTTLGHRMREKLGADKPPQVILKDRKVFLTEMYYQVRNMTNKQLQDYLAKSDVNKTNDKDRITFDADVYELVEKEIDNRKNSQKIKK